ncbi:5-hydroxytryptamine receptor 3A-like [Halichoeres trimaculatus]|uniref:5-hydroxytryptamine receptor 3A-like n=1 Tax=Halichoeres trimaculatus TaxID=147232 RepID=UPI003D9EDFD1
MTAQLQAAPLPTDAWAAASSHSSSITLEDVLESLENDLKQENFTESNCTETNWDVIKFLNLTKNKDQLVWTRPAKNSKTATRVNLDFLLYAILGVREKEQKFISYVWVDLIWKHYELHWDPDNFCGIKAVSIPTRLLWQPDLIIEERTEKNRAAESPLVHVNYRGWVLLRNDRVLVTTCRMQVYKFPFDSQSCTLSFKSVIHNSQQLLLKKIGNQSYTTEWTQEIMRTQSDWIFINITSSSKTVNNFDITQSMVVYTINMKRRSVLYVVNFIIPVLLFLVLDLASFMISENGGEMLTFKVTVLLAVTVMQLILNDILPSTSDKIPLIAIYCVGIFGFMMLSLLETVLVMYMMEQDSVPKDDEEVKHTVKHSLTEDCGVKQGKIRFCGGFAMNQCEDSQQGAPSSEVTPCGGHENQSKSQRPKHERPGSTGHGKSLRSELSIDRFIDFRDEDICDGER